MIEGQPQAPVAGVDDDRGARIVAGLRLPRGPGDEYRRDGVETRVPGRVRVGAELAEEFDLERCFLAGFPDRGRFERLAVIDEAAGKGPAGRRVLALDEDDAPAFPAVHDFDDDVNRGHGIAESSSSHLHSHSAGAIVGGTLGACQPLRPGPSTAAAGSRLIGEE